MILPHIDNGRRRSCACIASKCQHLMCCRNSSIHKVMLSVPCCGYRLYNTSVGNNVLQITVFYGPIHDKRSVLLSIHYALQPRRMFISLLK